MEKVIITEGGMELDVPAFVIPDLVEQDMIYACDDHPGQYHLTVSFLQSMNWNDNAAFECIEKTLSKKD